MPAFPEQEFLDRLVLGKGAAVTIGNNTIVFFKVEDVIYAIEAWCPRCGACLAEGRVDALVVACSGCDWRYEVNTGSVIGVRALRLQTFEVEVVDGQIIVAND